MRTLDELRTFFDGTLARELSVLEAQRKNRVQMIGIGAATGVVIFMVALAIAAAAGPPAIIIGVIAAVVAGAAIGSIGSSGYKRQFKASVIAPLVRFVDDGLVYRPEEYLPESVFKSSRMFSQDPDRYSGDDLVTGTIGKTALTFSEVHAEYKTTHRDSKGNTETEWHTIFKGLLFTADFNKDFHHVTVVLPDVAEKLLGRFGQALQGMTFLSDLKLVKLEDPDFEREFVVYSQDQIEARYILSPALMKRLFEFKALTRKEVHFSFVGSRIFVAIPYNEDLFEPKVFQTLLDFSVVERYFRDLEFAVGIVEDLNLNTRIWSKE
jgi:hypothetical protein